MYGKLAAGLVTLGIAISTTMPAQAATPQSHADQQAEGIIAILIGLHHQPTAAPLGSTKGSFIDASMVYGSD